MHRIGFVLTLGTLAAVSATAIDICLPALPEIGRTLGGSADEGAALITGYLAGYGAGQLFWGPLSDRFGRMGLLYLSVCCFVLTSIACALTGSLSLLVAMRVLQGVAGAGAPSIARAIARDQGGGPETMSLLSAMAVIIGGAPLIAPLVGSGLMAVADWRWIFAFLAAFGVVLLVAIGVFLGSRRRRARRDWISAAEYARSATVLFRAPEFLLGVGISSSVFGGYAAILGAGAIIVVERYGVSAESFGPLFSVAALTFLAGATLARRMARRVGRRRFLLLGAAVDACAGTGLAIAYGSDFSLAPLWALVCVYTFAFGLLMPAATAMALEPAGETAGLASSIIGTLQTMGGALMSYVVVSGLLGDSYSSFCLIIAGASVVSVALVLASERLGVHAADFGGRR